MIKIGLTGGIGSGKTIISKIFSTMGIPTYNADERSKYLLNTNPQLIISIKELFGEQAYINNMLNRKYIASLVFSDKEKLSALNSISHPAVEKDFAEWCAKQDKAPYVIKEAAILFESGAYKFTDKNIMVDAPEELRIERTIARDNVSVEMVKARMKNQWPADKLRHLADFIIINNDKTLILPQILKIDKIIRS